MEIYQNEIMQVAGFVVEVIDLYFDASEQRSWHYGMFDTYDDAVAFTHAYPQGKIVPIYKPVTH
jgi:hypothetical protein